MVPGCACCSGGAPEEIPAAPAASVEASSEQGRPAVPAAAPSSQGGETAAPGPAPAAPAPAAAAPAAAAPPVQTGAPAALTAQIVERVVEIVQRQQLMTPPSTMVVELPESIGARIAVSLHAAGVHLAFSGMASSEVGPLLPQLAAGLAGQGMNLAGWSADADPGSGERFDAPADDGGGESERGDRDRTRPFADYLS
jgi:hypothetical protein